VIPARFLFPVLVLLHLVISPVLFPILPLRLAHVLDKAVYTPALHIIPLGLPWYSQTLIYINPPASVVAYNVHVRLCHDLIPPSKQTWVLSSASTSMQMTRLDEQTLEIEQEEGFMHGGWDNIFRNSLHPMKIGQEVALSGLTVKVLSLTDDSRPKRVSFHFDIPLEDASLNFVQWRLYEYVPFTPPETGETVFLPAQPLKVL